MAELFLSRLVLDPNRREVWRAADDCQALHRAVMAAFPAGPGGPAREAFGVLHRLDLDPAPTLLVQSAVAPVWRNAGSAGGWAVGSVAVKDVGAAYDGIRAGQRLRFRLRANPTRRVNASVHGRDPLAGKRVDLRREEDRLDWLKRKGEQHGFLIDAADVRPGAPGNRARGNRGGSAPLAFGAAIFDGVLEVVDAAAFGAALRGGVGPGKAYGFGLLSVARAG